MYVKDLTALKQSYIDYCSNKLEHLTRERSFRADIGLEWLQKEVQKVFTYDLDEIKEGDGLPELLAIDFETGKAKVKVSSRADYVKLGYHMKDLHPYFQFYAAENEIVLYRISSHYFKS